MVLQKHNETSRKDFVIKKTSGNIKILQNREQKLDFIKFTPYIILVRK